MVDVTAVRDMEQGSVSFKAKTVRRTIGVIEYFAKENPRATVMDLVRSLGVPQSSMSELLSALVDSGVLVRDAAARQYAVTPKMAALGLAAQPQAIADGRLFRLMDEFANETGLTVGLFGVCGLDAQAHRVSVPDGARQVSSIAEADVTAAWMKLGARVRLSAGIIGQVLLAALGSEQYDRVLWRLLSEATEGQKFDYGIACKKVRAIETTGSGFGPSGFSDGWSAVSALLPSTFGCQPLALAAFYRSAAAIDETQLAADLKNRLLQAGGRASPVPDALREDVAA